MELNQPYYIEKRRGNAHISLDGEWDFCWTDDPQDTVSMLNFSYTTEIPSSVYHSLHRAGILPDPYYGTNSKQYHWVDEKIWYYRKRFTLDRANFCGNAYLSFDGVAYYARLWVNGVLLGDHEGMFGGPVFDVAQYLKLDGENEIVIEVKACNFGRKAQFNIWNNGQNREIVPFNIVRDRYTSNADFIVIGLWNRVRLELVPKLHISRPYLYTESLDENLARLSFEVEIVDGHADELSPFGVTKALCDLPEDLTVRVDLSISDEGGEVYNKTDEVPLTTMDKMGGVNPDYGSYFYRRTIEIEKPKLWYPNGLGDAHLYDVKVTLSYDGRVYDEHSFKTGIRTFTSEYTTGPKHSVRWEKFLFSVNGQRLFLKGINWTPIDYLYDISPERYEWCLTMVKNAGIQLIRVWNGGGMPEDDVFYEICDRLGLMVWQDLFITNTRATDNFPQDVLEGQISYNLYRLRNHASLVLVCGGNEFDPYTEGNAASMFVTERTARMLTPDRIFHHTTPNGGSAHIYLDMEPVWYRHRYRELPFLAESGIHSFPNFKSLRKLISEREANGALPDLMSESFKPQYPDLINHFSEYKPDRVPRMTARISQITDMANLTLAELCEASQVQAYEFYQLMIQAMQENYPRCGGVMPWVFKRPWTTSAVQLVDGNDLPTYSYYSVQNAYRPINICWCQTFSILAPKESIDLTVKVFNQHDEDLSDTKITLTVYRQDLSVYAEYKSPYAAEVDFGKLIIDDEFTDTCFLVSADLSRGGDVLARSTYFNKCSSLLADAELYNSCRSAPRENLRLDNGPWLKSSVASAKKAVLRAEKVGEGRDGCYGWIEICIENTSDVPAYPVTVDLADDAKRFFLNDSFFLLKGGEKKIIRITCREGEPGDFRVSHWNASSKD